MCAISMRTLQHWAVGRMPGNPPAPFAPAAPLCRKASPAQMVCICLKRETLSSRLGPAQTGTLSLSTCLCSWAALLHPIMP